ncbi:hypothetical protein [Gimesia panareensis]|uniref:Uncharacterized protein n=1 Tax=Gimesia panareensis TaxID=2527978 RepID=A0A518FPH9_9PLAN|nr:hypothetical protein [Gimesia panareensis]QDT25653.1 hypothetical protein Enr10x_09500 [Gimesia panareensis]QDU48598.1 hypothetical protein Pan110_09130 [Gimesia panareensis]QDV18249.1 hypothetical protein Pan153_29060 [Gimesia panareensis]
MTSVRTGSGDVSANFCKERAPYAQTFPEFTDREKQKAIETRLSALIFDGALQTGTAPARLPAQLQGAQAETEQGSDGTHSRCHLLQALPLAQDRTHNQTRGRRTQLAVRATAVPVLDQAHVRLGIICVSNPSVFGRDIQSVTPVDALHVKSHSCFPVKTKQKQEVKRRNRRFINSNGQRA